MTNNNELRSISNTYSTGGGGHDFENSVGSVFLLSLLIDGFAPVLGITIEKIEFQAKKSGYNTDDIVVFGNKNTITPKLLCQVKHKVTVSENNREFKEVIKSAWTDFKAKSFSPKYDRIVLITSVIAAEAIQSMRRINDIADSCNNCDSFYDQIKRPIFVSEDVRKRISSISKIIGRDFDNLSEDDKIDLWMFFRCFSILQIDIETRNSFNDVLIKTLIKCKSDVTADFVWSLLYRETAEYNKKGSIVTLDELPPVLKESFGINYAFNINSGYGNDLLTNLFFIGSWNESKEYDISIVEKIIGKKYSAFKKELIKAAENNDVIAYHDSNWKVVNRKNIYEVIKNGLDNKAIANAFDVVYEIINTSKSRDYINGIAVINDDIDRASIIISEILKGLCIVTNSNPSKYIDQDSIIVDSSNFVRNVFNILEVSTIELIGDSFSLLAEISPEVYLDSLFDWINNNSKTVQALFPQEASNLLINSNKINYFIKSLELLAWKKEYLNKCLRCLVKLESFDNKETNYANNPMNALVNVLNPYYPQTIASAEAIENSIMDIRNCSEGVFWPLLEQLIIIPRGVYFPTEKPKYIEIPNISEEEELNRRNELISFYDSLALESAGIDADKLAILIDDLEYKDVDLISKYLNTIITNAPLWDEKSSSKVWLKLCEKRIFVLAQNEEEITQTETYKKLNEAITATTPKDIYYLYKSYYCVPIPLSDYDNDKYNEHKKKQQEAIYDLFSSRGIDTVIRFAEEIDKTCEVAVDLGYSINIDELKIIVDYYSKSPESLFFKKVFEAYFRHNTITTINDLDWTNYSLDFVASLLSLLPFCTETFNIVENILQDNANMYWQIASPFPYIKKDNSYDIKYVIKMLTNNNRYAAAINIFEHTKSIPLDKEKISELLHKACISSDSNDLSSNAVLNVIRYMQNLESVNIDDLADIEWIYYPLFRYYTSDKPKALYYKLSNNPEFFCSKIEMFFKKKSSSKSSKKPDKATIERLAKLFFKYEVVPGVDWNGEFNDNAFISWIDKVKKWGRDNDRISIVLSTIGNGLSYAQKKDGFPNDTILKELNLIDNYDMRKGYAVGILNQRGVSYLDPEGRPEKEKAKEYTEYAERAERIGYLGVSEMFKMIAKDYSLYAEYIVKQHKNRGFLTE